MASQADSLTFDTEQVYHGLVKKKCNESAEHRAARRSID